MINRKGMLASFFRIKHPELVFASVASSAPVIAQLDMPEYNNIAAEEKRPTPHT